MLFSLALIPVIGLMLFIYFNDKKEKEPFWFLMILFFAGMSTVVSAIIFETVGDLAIGLIVPLESVLGGILSAMLVVAPAEEFGKYIIKAGQYEGRFPIYFIKPENYEQFKEQAGKIKFRLKENDKIKAGARETSSLLVKLQNGLVIPDHWNVAPLYFLRLSQYFGTYSAVKHSLLIQVSGKTEFRIYSNRTATINDTEAMSIAEATNYKDLCKNKLIEHKQVNNGQALLDENGLEVTFP